MSVIHTNKTGTGFNSGQTGAMADATNAPPPSPVLLTDLVAGWALTSGPQQTLDSTGVIASGVLDLTNNNNVTFGANGALFTGPPTQFLSHVDAPSLRLDNNHWLVSAIITLPSPIPATSLTFVSRTDTNTYLENLTIGYGNGANRIQVYGEDNVGNYTTVNADNFGVPMAGSRIHVMSWWNFVTQTLYISVNGGSPNSSALGTPLAYSSDSQLRLGSEDGSSQAVDTYELYTRFWKGDNALTVASTYATYLTNLTAGSASGRTDAEFAAYTG